VYVWLDEGSPSKKAQRRVHIASRLGRVQCSAGKNKRYSPFPGRPRQEDICQTCLSLNEGWQWKEPRLSKLLGEA